MAVAVCEWEKGAEGDSCSEGVAGILFSQQRDSVGFGFVPFSLKLLSLLLLSL